VIKTHPCEAQAELVGAQGADVAVADVGEVAFKVAFHPSGDGEARVLRHPLCSAGPIPEAAGFHVEFRIG